jgi:hypothetical protein
VPNAHNVPLFQAKHEVRLSAGACAGDEYTGGDFQAAVAITDHIGVMVNGFTAKGEEEYEEFHLFSSPYDDPEIIHNTGKGHFVEFGPGLYIPLFGHEKGVFETFAGIGSGSVTSGYNSTSSDIKFQRYSLQPSIGYTGRVFDIAFSTRFAILNYTDIKYQTGLPADEILYLRNLSEKNLSLLIEPAVTIRLGYQNVKLQGQFGSSNNRSIEDFRNNFNFNLGILFSITDKYRNDH